MHRLLFCALAVVAGCHVDLNDPGTEPQSNMFHFPAGLVLDPGGKFLYVSNANSDLKYSGGTIMMIDLERFDRAVKAFRGEPTDAVSVADAKTCIKDPLDPMVVDCPETSFVLADQTVKVGNFAGNMQLRDFGDHRRLFVGVRGDPSVTFIDVYPNGAPAPDGRMLRCFDGSTNLAGITSPPACASNHQIQFFQCTGDPSCMMGNGTYPAGKQLIPTEPFGMMLDEGNLANGSPYHRLVLSHLKEGRISIVDADAAGGDTSIQYVSNPFFPEDSQHRHGAFSLAPQHPGTGASSLWYLTSNIQPSLATFRIADANVVIPAVNFSIASLFSNGSDLRSLVFQPDGNRMFVTENAPPSVLVFDTSPQTGPVMPGQPQAALRDVIDVCTLPSHLEMYPLVWQGPAGTPPRTLLRLYVMCFIANQIMVVDPDRAGVDDTILVGRGPNDIVFRSGPGISPRAYVTNFSEHTIGLVDLQPGSPTEHRMTARIGLPVPPMNF